MEFQRKGFFAGLSVLAAAIVYVMIASSFFIITNGNFSALRASKTAMQAQQYADIDANTLKLLSYDTLDEKGAHARQDITTIDGADGWQDEVIIADERIVDETTGSKQRIATVKVYKKGDTLSRFSVQVPLSSQGSSASGFPDYKKGISIGFTYIAPQNGWIYCQSEGRNFALVVNGHITAYHAINPDQMDSVFFPVSKNDVISIHDNYDNRGYWATFYPCQ